MSILAPDGRRATSSGPVLYQTTIGLFYTTEPPKRDGDGLCFNPAQTVVVTPQRTPQGITAICLRLDQAWPKPKDFYRVHGSCLHAVMDSVDDGVLDQCERALRGADDASLAGRREDN